MNANDVDANDPNGNGSKGSGSSAHDLNAQVHQRADRELDQVIAQQLHSYAEAAGSQVASERESPARVSGRRLALAGLAAAAVIALVAGVVVRSGGSGDQRVSTPADAPSDERPSPDRGVDQEPCPGAPIRSGDHLSMLSTFHYDSAEGDSGSPGIDAIGRWSGVNTPDSYVQVTVSEIDHLAQGDPGPAQRGPTTTVTMCDPTSASLEPVELEAVSFGSGIAGLRVRVEPAEDTMPVLYVAVSSGSPRDLREAFRALRWTTPSETSLDATTRTSDVATTTVPAEAQPPDGASETARISFGSVDGYMVGQVVPPDAPGVQVGEEFGGLCGYWEPEGSGSTATAEPPDISMRVVRRDPSAPLVVDWIYVSGSEFSTEEGVTVGASLADLQRIYRSALTIDRADGWDNPTAGLLASYRDVAATTEGDSAITFVLRDDVVHSIKVSALADWGDDEGCA